MKFECDLIRDLMPLCADDAASESSKKAVQTHIAVCTECAREWDSICGELTVSADAPPPESKYTDAAKKYRIKQLCRIVFCMIAVILLGVGWWVSPLSSGHFTPEGVVRTAMRRQDRNTISDFSEYEIVERYEWKSKETVTFWVIAKNVPYFSMIEAERGKWGLYFNRRGAYAVIHADQGIELLCGNGFEMDDMSVFYIYAKDTAVHTVRMTLDGHTVRETVGENRFCTLCFESSAREEIQDLYGEALDADGNVLYTLDTASNPLRLKWFPAQ